jgi:transcriptional regulator GlxA family with amidase domain
MTALDAVGPYEVLARMPDTRVRFVGRTAGMTCRADAGLGLVADLAFEQMPRPDVLLVPGSSDPRGAIRDPATMGWIAAAARTATWTTSVCSGSLLLAAAGVLRGRRATTHWIAFDDLERLGAVPVRERVVVDGSIMTAAGVTAGIELALRLAAVLHGDDLAQALQLAVEYDPAPPYDIPVHSAPEALRRSAGSRLAPQRGAVY